MVDYLSPFEFLHGRLDDCVHFRSGPAGGGYQLDQVHVAPRPDDWKPYECCWPMGCGKFGVAMPWDIQVSVCAKFDDAVLVLHCFPEKTQKTSNADRTWPRTLPIC